ncbi:MAG: glycoside hydrolase/phage tail family protein [Alphaproteobacteria bacterium]|nr:glycoside hydrolase/phage tail family protein [Alphaproteobacteria bacterium]
MATLAFQAVGAALGSSLLPGGVSLLGATITGATIGSQIGAIAGSFADQALFGAAGQTRSFQGPRLEDLRVTASREGSPIPRVYGAARVGGQVIWATDFVEVRSSNNAGGQSKGGGFGTGGGTTVTYNYFANFAVALAEGEITGLGRVWADGEEWDLSNVAYRVYFGGEEQQPDALIEAELGAGEAPAYRGTAYIVFEHMPIAEFGNRLPQLSFEIFRVVDNLHTRVRGIVIIPGSGEFVYATTPVSRREVLGEMVPENVHTREASTNWSASMDQMQRSLPNLASASLVTSWFADDLRAGQCRIRPGVERREKVTRPVSWQVAGQARANAYVVSQSNGRPAFGGTPTDDSIVQAIQDLRERGIKPVLTPFILMDVPDGNQLPNPYTGEIGQPGYPWRGRITVDPAPGEAASPDKTAAATGQVESFVGSAAVDDFAIENGRVVYSGPDEWSYRRFILHYAHLAVAAGGVDSFVIGTEMRGLTTVRSAPGSYPFVEALVDLAADVRAVVGPAAKVTYAADWSEYFGHQPADGSGDVFFHLDPLWASSDIDAIGIDLYWPLADWRDGLDHIDAAEARSIYDLGYLKGNIRGGEGFDWFYASDADRNAQRRTAITDGQGKPWVFRYKDLLNWWSNPHYDRPGGVEASAPTAWQPHSKPVWLMEAGCPALDKGANQPNVFYDPKSSESRLPHFASRRRDDFMQRVYLQALIEGLDPDHAGYVPGTNPVSPVYGETMIDLARLHVYAWDARPYPAFPNDEATWGDAANWTFGHWINGRIASMPLADAVFRLFTDYGFDAFVTDELEGVLPGYVIDRVMSLREAMQPIEMAFFIDTVESGERIRLRHRGSGAPAAMIGVDELVTTKESARVLSVIRGQETDLPASAKVTYAIAGGDYRAAVAEARRLTGFSERVATASLAMMLEPDRAQMIAENWLHETWAARRRATFALPPSRLAIEPGDMVVTREADGLALLHRVTEVADHGARDISAQSIDPAIYLPHEARGRSQDVASPPVTGQATALFVDVPLVRDGGAETDGYVAVHQSPWPGPIAIYQSPADDGFTLAATANGATTIGMLAEPMFAGPPARIDHANRIKVSLEGGALFSVGRLALFDGANAVAVQRDDGSWEVCQFERSELVGELTYELSGLLRGQLGTEDWLAPGTLTASTGRPVVMLDDGLVRVPVGETGTGRPFNWRYGPLARDVGHPDFAQQGHTFVGLPRRPLAPVHVRAERVGADLTIRWTRRTRIGGDNWQQLDVALGEQTEAYEVDILDGGQVKRTLASATTAVSYPQAQQVADFGAVPTAIACRVFQLSATWGRGMSREVVV